jgi:hypothetical protein
LESRHSKLAAHLESLGGGTFSFYGSWFRSFFVGWITSEVSRNAPPHSAAPHLVVRAVAGGVGGERARA